MKILIINGVNLNLTGKREKGIYGEKSLEEIEKNIAAYAKKNGDEVEFFQSNIEGEICSKLHEAFLERTCGGILLNAGAYAHYSYAIRDAIAAVDIPVVEVHMSNIAAREDFRKKSVLSDVCSGVVFGFGQSSYIAGIAGLKGLLEERK
jgi:3-dehydroquinate dehydratase-2